MIDLVLTLLQQDKDAARSLLGAIMAFAVGAGALFVLLLVLMVMRRVVLGGPKGRKAPRERVDPWVEAGRRLHVEDDQPHGDEPEEGDRA